MKEHRGTAVAYLEIGCVAAWHEIAFILYTLGLVQDANFMQCVFDFKNVHCVDNSKGIKLSFPPMLRYDRIKLSYRQPLPIQSRHQEIFDYLRSHASGEIRGIICWSADFEDDERTIPVFGMPRFLRIKDLDSSWEPTFTTFREDVDSLTELTPPNKRTLGQSMVYGTIHVSLHDTFVANGRAFIHKWEVRDDGYFVGTRKDVPRSKVESQWIQQHRPELILTLDFLDIKSSQCSSVLTTFGNFLLNFAASLSTNE